MNTAIVTVLRQHNVLNERYLKVILLTIKILIQVLHCIFKSTYSHASIKLNSNIDTLNFFYFSTIKE